MDGTKTCPYCGKLASADAQFCQGCGRSISSPQQTSAEQPPQQGGWQQPSQQNYQQPPQQGGWQQSPPGAPGQMPIGQSYGGGAKGQIAGAIQNRNMTDDIMSGIWTLWPILAIVIALIIGVVLVLVIGIYGIMLAIPIGIILYAVLNYKLLKRMDEHRKREMALRMAIISYLKDKGAETQRAQLIANEISALESINQEAMYKEKERTPVLWTIISLIPLLNLVVMYFLGEFPFDHDKRWHAFTQYTQVACQKLGINVMTPSWSTLKERPNVILLIATLLISIIVFYWYYIIIKDLNDHFQAQWQFEDQLMAQLR
ncbi:MAG TPA: zinc ribbon domain-containing protein [Methanomassiliicoccales archaeon]|nr:zinc ribbon domain-containing protein [Methanomassiliicoccales archaeon]